MSEIQPLWRCPLVYVNGFGCDNREGHEGRHVTLFGDGGTPERQRYWGVHSIGDYLESADQSGSKVSP